MSNIEWTGKTLNIHMGCDKTSQGCKNCYAVPMAYRLEAMARAKIAKNEDPKGLANYIGLTHKVNGELNWTSVVNFNPDVLEIPRKTKKPTVYFVNSMSDIGHKYVTEHQFLDFFAMVLDTPHHTYQILTKRPGTLRKRLILAYSHFGIKQPLKNLWVGITAENQHRYEERINLLINTIAHIRFISFEPVLSPIHITISQDLLGDKIHWAILGGESGDNARESHIEYLQSLKDQCQFHGIKVFVKQLGENTWFKSKPIKIKGKGNTHDDLARFNLDVREYPIILDF